MYDWCVYSSYTIIYESKYGGGNALITNVISPFYVNAFFVVNGFLFFRKWLNVDKKVIPGKDDLFNVLFKLIIPTLIFSSLVYIPKILFHSRGLSMSQFVYDIFGGISYWFTSAIAVSQIILLIALRFGCRTITSFSIISLIVISLMPILKYFFPEAMPWYWKSGLAAITFMTLGGCVYLCHNQLARYRRLLYIAVPLLYIIGVYASFKTGNALYALMSVTFNLKGVFVTLCGIAFIFIISYRGIPDIRILQFIGNHSIIFYFFSGVIPATLSALPFIRIITSVWGMLIVAGVAISIGVLLTWLIVCYMPFLTDLRKLKSAAQK